MDQSVTIDPKNAAIEYLRDIEKPSGRQKRLLMLVSLSERSPEDDEVLDALLDVEVARMTQRDALIRLRKKDSKANSKSRRDRTTLLCKLGGLAQIAGLADFDRAVILGALMDVSKADEQTRARWKEAGGAELGRRTPARRAASSRAVP